MQKLNQSIMLPVNVLEANTGQIAGLPANPRTIDKDKFEKLKKSIQENPEMLTLREILVYSHNGKYVVIGGNMRLRALKELKYTEAPCKVIEECTPEQLKAYTIKDNAGFGDWDYDMLANEWDVGDLENWGLDLNFEENDPEEEPTNLDASANEHPFVAKITFTDDRKMNEFQMKEYKRLCETYDCTISISGGEL